jgi:CRISPR-associated protein Csb2
MFAIRVTFLMGRAYLARFEDGDEKRASEWPPHPGRLFSALVAAWGETGSCPDEQRALRWLEERPRPPSILFAEASQRLAVRSYVPVNDERSIPEYRSRQPRRFPSVFPTAPDVCYLWPHDDLPADLRAPLQSLAAKVTSVGHSSSLAVLEPSDNVPSSFDSSGYSLLGPDENGNVRIRVPSPGRLEDLCARYELFRSNPIKVHRPGPGKSVRYGAPAVTVPPPRRSLFREMVILRRSEGEPLPLNGTLLLTQALRGAMMGLAPQPCPECISGHAPNATSQQPARSERDHVAFAPLPFVGSRHATGQLMGVALLLPDTLSDEERDVCLATVVRISELHMGKAGAWRVEMANEETPEFNLRTAAWTRASRLWATVTPFVFDRYPKDPYGEEAVDTVRRACLRVGLPAPASVSLTPVSPHIGVPHSARFSPAPARDGKPRRYHHHVVFAFSEPVGGPIVIGAGRYYGYGFCRPLREGA